VIVERARLGALMSLDSVESAGMTAMEDRMLRGDRR
jgi:hypothetical protein